jgi:hypothetical protein
LLIVDTDSGSELELYWKHASESSQDTRRPPSATYLVTGEQIPKRGRFEDDFRMSIDTEDDVSGSQDGYSDTEDPDIPEVSVVLVHEPELEGMHVFLPSCRILITGGCFEDVKSQFLRTYSVHVYSLSPSPIRVGLPSLPTPVYYLMPPLSFLL